MAKPVTVLTSEKIQQVEAIIAAGNTRECAAESCGVERETFHAWLRKGRVEPDSVYGELVDAVQRADRAAEQKHVKNVTLAADSGTWQASAWWLERRKRADYGRAERVEVSGANGGPVVAAVAAITVADLAAMGATELARVYAEAIGRSATVGDLGSDTPSDSGPGQN